MPATDTFTDTAGTLVTDHTPDGGGSWSVPGGSTAGVITAAGRARTNVGGGSSNIHIHSAVAASPDIAHSLDLIRITNTTSNTAGIVGRVDLVGDNWYLLRHLGTNIQLLRRVAGSYSSVLAASAFTPTLNTPFTLTLDMAGAVIRGLKDGVEVINYTDATPITAAGQAGFGVAGQNQGDAAGMHVDNFWGVPAASGVVGPLVGGRLTRSMLIHGRLIRA